MPPSPSDPLRSSSLRLSLNCEFESVRPAALKARDFLTTQHWSEDDIMAAELVIAEACNNAIEYADTGGREKPVDLEIISEPARLEIRVTDHTGGFHWPEQIVLPEPDSEGGRGLFVITLMMDHAKYFRGPGENVLVMQKERTPAKEVPGLFEEEAGSPDDKKARDQEEIITELIEEVSSCYESLSTIFRYSTELAARPDLKEFAQRLLADLCQIISADWYVLRLLPKSDAYLHVLCASEPGLELGPLLLSDDGSSSRFVETEAAETRQQVWFDAEHPLVSGDPLAGVKSGSHGLVHPFFLGEVLIGTLTVGKSAPRVAALGPAREVFTAGQSSVVGTFADFLAIQIVNTRLHEEQVSNRLVAHELEIAKGIQQSLLPKSLPQIPGCSLAAYCESARQVGGDFYDVIKISDTALLLVIADVMGKGVPAALFAAILRTLLRAAPELTGDPSALLGRVNKLLFQELSGVDMFITAQLAMVDVARNQLIVASAGHCPLLFVDKKSGKAATLSPEGMPLGVLVDNEFKSESVALPETWCLLIYTDGVTESVNRSREDNDTNKLAEWFREHTSRTTSSEDIKRALVTEMLRSEPARSAGDDQTFMVMCH